MRHCVASYSRWCLLGWSTIWSMRCYGPTGDERRLTIEVLPQRRFVRDALGFCNRRAKPEEREILKLWAQREGLELASWI